MAGFKLEYSFSSVPWQYTGPAGWVFISLPKKLSKEIRETCKREETGWGRLSATAKIGNTEWKTAIWFDTKADAYLLPLKAAIRNKEKVEPGKKLEVTLFI